MFVRSLSFTESIFILLPKTCLSIFSFFFDSQDIPGPGAYSVQELSKPTAINSPGFLSSAKRDDKVSQKFFTRNFVSNFDNEYYTLLNLMKFVKGISCLFTQKCFIPSRSD